MSYRFYGVSIAEVNLDNFYEKLPSSLALQIEMFLPPTGSFDDECLHRYLEILKKYEDEDENSHMTLANRLRVAFRDMQPSTICGRFPTAELPLKRRLRCVAEYLIRSGEFSKLLESLRKQGIIK